MQNFNVNNLRIATPCPMGWENMEGDERVRFCRLCELNVHNISEMTSVEVQSLVANSGGRICGRLYQKADGTVLTRDCPVGVRGYRKRAAKYTGAALTAILGLFTVGFGQSDRKDTDSQTKIVRTPSTGEKKAIKGLVVDINGAVAPGVKVTLIDGKGKKTLAKTNENGEYDFSFSPAGNFVLVFELKGFKTHRIENISHDKDEVLEIDVNLFPKGESVTVGILTGESLIDSVGSGSITRIGRKRIESLPY